jgi:hypothetical protein
MPVEYSIDVATRLVRTRAWGAVTFVEITQLQHALLADPAFDKTFNELCDCLDIGVIELTTEELRLLAHPHVFGEHSRRAVVYPADRPVIRGLVRMFEAFRDSSGGRERIRAFDDLVKAMDWLEGA